MIADRLSRPNQLIMTESPFRDRNLILRDLKNSNSGLVFATVHNTSLWFCLRTGRDGICTCFHPCSTKSFRNYMPLGTARQFYYPLVAITTMVQTYNRKLYHLHACRLSCSTTKQQDFQESLGSQSCSSNSHFSVPPLYYSWSVASNDQGYRTSALSRTDQAAAVQGTTVSGMTASIELQA